MAQNPRIMTKIISLADVTQAQLEEMAAIS